jgi:hypothetical protein
MNKKATAIIVMIFELLAVVIVSWMAISVGKSFGESDTVTKINAAEDIRMMVNVLIGVPGDAVVQYPKDLSKFALLFTVSGVEIFVEGESSSKSVIRNFMLPINYKAEGVVKKVKSVCLEKKNKKILIRECKEDEKVDIKVHQKLGEPDSKGIYTYDAGMFVTTLYYRYIDSSWQWSPDKNNWMPTTTLFVKGGEWDSKKPHKENIEIIKYLEKYNPDPNPKNE